VTLGDGVCDEIIAQLRPYDIPGYSMISRRLVRHVAATKLFLTDKPTSPYSLFLFREYFREHPPDAVSLLGDVVRDDS